MSKDWDSEEIDALLCKIDQGYIPTAEEKDALSNVKELFLLGDKFKKLPESLGALIQLQSLDISCTNIKELPDSIGSLSQLQSLDIRFTPIKELPNSIGSLGQLQSLDIGHTNIKELPDSIGSLSQLQSLDIRFTPIKELPNSIGSLGQLQSLDISHTNIKELPDSIGSLGQLQSLDISHTNIKELPDSIGSLGQLQGLNICFTPIKELPDSIRSLGQLQILDIGDTLFQELPVSIASLGQLQSLNIRGSDIEKWPDSIASLCQLKSLNISRTNIKELPDFIASLSQLQDLNISRTDIKELPDSFASLGHLKRLDLSYTSFQELPEEIGNIPSLQYLDISGLTIPMIPRSLALRKSRYAESMQSDSYFNWSARDHFYRSGRGKNNKDDYPVFVYMEGTVLTEQDRTVFLETPKLIPSLYEEMIPLYECRVLFLGDGDSGKSYTIKRIRNGGEKETEQNPYVTKETPGVEIIDYAVQESRENYTIHFWDFGGQEILHSMHRCFLSDGTCYVVTVKSRETKGTQRARYWLRNIAAFAPNSKVLLFVNCWENDDGRRAIDEPRLKRDYPNIVDVVYCSAKEAEAEEFNAKLMKPLIKMATGSEGCIREVNQNWNAVRKAILEESRVRHYLTKARYRELCKANSIRQENAPALLTFFNALGVCFSYHRDEENNELENYKLLSPVWMTNAIYAIIEEGMAHAQEGKIKAASIQQILGNQAPEMVRGKSYRRTMPGIVYTKTECQYVTDVAAAHNLCYKADQNTLFFPALCTNNTPEEAMGDQEGFPHHAEYRFRYEYLPDSVLHRLMIRCLKKGFAIRACWLRGMIFDCLDTHRAIVRMDDDETLCVDIWYQNNNAAWEIFPMLRSEILSISDSMNLKPKEMVADQTDTFPMVQLLSAHRSGGNQCWGNNTGNEYSVKELLRRFYDDATIACLEILDGRLVIKPYAYHYCKKDNPALRRAIYEAYGQKCQYCNLPIGYDEMEIDHILATNHIPGKDNRVELYLARLEQRGFDLKHPDYIENYFPSCGKCNRGKSNATRDAVTLLEYHAIAMEHLEKVLSLMKKYETAFAKSSKRNK